jgi:hypothetical protein
MKKRINAKHTNNSLEFPNRLYAINVIIDNVNVIIATIIIIEIDNMASVIISLNSITEKNYLKVIIANLI